jgi:hypothetical protein
MITISVSEGSVSVLRCESMGLVVFLQYDGVGRAVGNGPGGDMSDAWDCGVFGDVIAW